MDELRHTSEDRRKPWSDMLVMHAALSVCLTRPLSIHVAPRLAADYLTRVVEDIQGLQRSASPCPRGCLLPLFTDHHHIRTTNGGSESASQHLSISSTLLTLSLSPLYSLFQIPLSAPMDAFVIPPFFAQPAVASDGENGSPVDFENCRGSVGGYCTIA